MGGAEQAARIAAEELRLPVITNGQGRGLLPRGHELLVTRARSAAFREADLVVVVGTPLDFRLGYGAFGDQNDPQRKPAVVHVADAPGQVAAHAPLAASYAGDLGAFFAALVDPAAWPARPPRAAWEESWLPRLQDAARQAIAADGALLASEASPIHPMRIYGELARVLDDDAVVIGDGGDFVSYAGKCIEPGRPGGWLDPGPYGCLGTGLGYAIAARLARPADQVVLLLGDGAAGFSLMDADTLVRHGLPVVMVCGNNGIWGLEKHPMHAIYGYDVAADLQPQCRYDEVVSALGGAGELVTRPERYRPRAAPGLRVRGALPGQRDHRPRGRLPEVHDGHLTPRPTQPPAPDRPARPQPAPPRPGPTPPQSVPPVPPAPSVTPPRHFSRGTCGLVGGLWGFGHTFRGKSARRASAGTGARAAAGVGAGA